MWLLLASCASPDDSGVLSQLCLVDAQPVHGQAEAGALLELSGCFDSLDDEALTVVLFDDTPSPARVVREEDSDARLEVRVPALSAGRYTLQVYSESIDSTPLAIDITDRVRPSGEAVGEPTEDAFQRSAWAINHLARELRTLSDAGGPGSAGGPTETDIRILNAAAAFQERLLIVAEATLNGFKSQQDPTDRSLADTTLLHLVGALAGERAASAGGASPAELLADCVGEKDGLEDSYRAAAIDAGLGVTRGVLLRGAAEAPWLGSAASLDGAADVAALPYLLELSALVAEATLAVDPVAANPATLNEEWIWGDNGVRLPILLSYTLRPQRCFTDLNADVTALLERWEQQVVEEEAALRFAEGRGAESVSAEQRAIALLALFARQAGAEEPVALEEGFQWLTDWLLEPLAGIDGISCEGALQRPVTPVDTEHLFSYGAAQLAETGACLLDLDPVELQRDMSRFEVNIDIAEAASDKWPLSFYPESCMVDPRAVHTCGADPDDPACCDPEVDEGCEPADYCSALAGAFCLVIPYETSEGKTISDCVEDQGTSVATTYWSWGEADGATLPLIHRENVDLEDLIEASGGGLTGCRNVDGDCYISDLCGAPEDASFVDDPACEGIVGAEPDDCDDDASRYPGADEVGEASSGRGVDNDCDGEIDEDTEWYDDDGDCYCESELDADCVDSISEACITPRGGDCNDSDPEVYPGAADDIFDDIDGDCDFEDADSDGYLNYYAGGDDCDDYNSSINPGAAEVWYDGIDQDCDPTNEYDRDGDGHALAGSGGEDCDDGDEDVNPGADETWYDGIDQDCDGASDFDADGDGVDCDREQDAACTEAVGSGDCDDSEPATSPDEEEICDGIDNDCDELIDDEDPLISLSHPDTLTWYQDGDGDGYGTALGDPVYACLAPPGTSAAAGDCDDSAAAINPCALELCDTSEDEDCDKSVDESVCAESDTGDTGGAVSDGLVWDADEIVAVTWDSLEIATGIPTLGYYAPEAGEELVPTALALRLPIGEATAFDDACYQLESATLSIVGEAGGSEGEQQLALQRIDGWDEAGSETWGEDVDAALTQAITCDVDTSSPEDDALVCDVLELLDEAPERDGLWVVPSADEGSPWRWVTDAAVLELRYTAEAP